MSHLFGRLEHQQLIPDHHVDVHDDADRACPGPHPVTAIPPGRPVWCFDCEQRIAAALQPPAHAPGVLGIADLLAKVASRRDGRLLTIAPPAARRGPGRSKRSPSPAFDEVEEHIRWAAGWALLIATDLGHPPSHDLDGADQRRLPWLAHTLAYLGAHTRPALVGTRAADFGADVPDVHRRLQHLAGEQVQRRRLKLPCPACDALGLIREDGRDLVECTACAITWTEPDFQTALATQAS